MSTIEMEPMPRPSIRMSSGALVVSSAALAGSLGISSEIAAAILYGVFLTCLAAATVAYTLGVLQRPAPQDSDGFAGPDPGATGRLSAWRGLDVEVALRRQSNTRLQALLSASNPTGQTITLDRLAATAPAGAKISLADADGGDVTINFHGPESELQIDVGPGESRTVGFYILLPADATAAPTACFSIGVVSADRHREVAFKRRIPG